VRVLLLTLAVLALTYVAVLGALVLAGRRTAAREVARLLPNLAFLFKGLLGDERIPRRSKALLLVAAVWIASPIDLIPEFIPFLGPLDDAVVAALVLRHLVRIAGEQVVTEHWRGDPETLHRVLRLFAVRRPR
jgi:uncharacterized membrane protein YkvA (DUF1232 family)